MYNFAGSHHRHMKRNPCLRIPMTKAKQERWTSLCRSKEKARFVQTFRNILRDCPTFWEGATIQCFQEKARLSKMCQKSKPQNKMMHKFRSIVNDENQDWKKEFARCPFSADAAASARCEVASHASSCRWLLPSPITAEPAAGKRSA